MTYRPLPQAEYRHDAYRLIPIRYEDREPIRAWRNAQLDVLRQAAPLTSEQQEAYFQRVVLPLLEQEKPGQLLFSLLHEDKLIAYGGLVHISWAKVRRNKVTLSGGTRGRYSYCQRCHGRPELRGKCRVGYHASCVEPGSYKWYGKRGRRYYGCAQRFQREQQAAPRPLAAQRRRRGTEYARRLAVEAAGRNQPVQGVFQAAGHPVGVFGRG